MARWFAKINQQDRLTATTAFVVLVLLTGLYSLTYSGIFKSGDEALFVSSAVSLGGWGNLSATPDGLRAIDGGNVEPLQALVGAGIYQLAHLGKVGTVHALFLTNVYLMALTGVVVFLLVRQRNHRLMTAVAAALIFGLGTQAWPQAKLYFRDPLAMFFTAFALLSFERIFARATWYGQGLQWFLTLGLLGAGILAKNTAVFALPAFLISAGVRAVVHPAERRGALVGLAGVAFLAGLASTIPAVGPLRLFSLMRYVQALSGLLQGHVGGSFGEAVIGALVSPGKGLFVESPGLLLAVIALPLTDKRERLQHLTPWLTLLGLVVGLAYYRINSWYGGTGWGIRHLLPVVPMFAATCAPALEAIARSGRIWIRFAAAGLILLSVAIQVGAVLLLPEVYYGWLWQVKQAPWTGAIWNPLYAEAVGYWRLLLSGGPLDLAWLRIYPYHRLAIAGLIGAWVAIGAGAWLVLRFVLRGASSAKVLGVSAGLAALSLTVMPYFLLRAYYPDPYYSKGRDDFRAAGDYVVQKAYSGDAMIIRGLSDPLWKYFINYVYSPVMWYAYDPYAPDDTPSAAALDEMASTPWLKPDTQRLFATILPQQHARLWAVSDECTAWADLRLEERWLAKRYVAVSSQLFQADKCATRVSLFALATTPAQQPVALNFNFGDAIHLASAVRLGPPDQSALKPGDVLPLRLEWRLSQPVSMDYTIGVYLLDAGGALKTQQDGSARGGFYPMTHWPVSAAVPDQHGLELPGDLRPGNYQVAVAVYNWQTGERLPVTKAGGRVPDSLARLLTVQVSAP